MRPIYTASIAVEPCIDSPLCVAHDVRCGRLGRMRVGPQARGNGEGINPLALPPGPHIAATVKLSMMQPANGNGEAIADFPAHCPLLRELDVVSI